MGIRFRNLSFPSSRSCFLDISASDSPSLTIWKTISDELSRCLLSFFLKRSLIDLFFLDDLLELLLDLDDLDCLVLDRVSGWVEFSARITEVGVAVSS